MRDPIPIRWVTTATALEPVADTGTHPAEARAFVTAVAREDTAAANIRAVVLAVAAAATALLAQVDSDTVFPEAAAAVERYTPAARHNHQHSSYSPHVAHVPALVAGGQIQDFPVEVEGPEAAWTR